MSSPMSRVFHGSTVGAVQASFEYIGTRLSSSWNCFVRADPDFEFSWHYHDEYELTLITRGSGRRFVGDSIEAYDPGDLALIGSRLPHTYVSTAGPVDDMPGNEAVVMQFRRDFLGPSLFDAPEFAALARLLDRSRRGIQFAGTTTASIVERIRALPVQQPAPRTMGLLEILGILAGSPGADELCGVDQRPPPGAGDRSRIDAMCRYLGTAYSEQVTLGDVAAIAHLTPAACSRFFRRWTGRTITEYLTELRLGDACRLLTDTALPIAHISTRCGFGNLSNFNRRFRAAKRMSPHEYRASFAGPMGVARPGPVELRHRAR